MLASEASEQLIALTNGDDKSDLVISIVACCHRVNLCTSFRFSGSVFRVRV